MPLTADNDIARLLRDTRTIAMIGASGRPGRASNGVMQFLQRQGYRVIPVNPTIAGQELNGETVVASLDDIEEPIDMVDIFRRSDRAGEAIEAAIAAGAKSVWTQLGVIDEAAAARAEAAGLEIVMDRCPKIEIPRLGLQPVGGGPTH